MTNEFLIVTAFLLGGMALRRLPSFPSETGNVLTLFVIYVSLPALILLKIPTLTFSKDLLAPAIMPWVMLIFSAALVWILARLARWDRATTGCLLLMIPLGNTSFLGIPMVKVFFGEQAVSYALLYDQLGSFLALATYGTLILALYGKGDTNPEPRYILKRVISFPPFVALVLAFALKSVDYPSVVVSLLESLSATLVPLVMMAVGYHLTLRLHGKAVGPLSTGLAVKLVVAPLVALLLCRMLGLEGESVQVSILEAGMPPMVSAGALAIAADLSPALTAALVGLGIVLSFATLPILYQLLV